MKEIILNVEGMICGGCENRVVNALMNIEGVESVKADHTEGKVLVTVSTEIEENILKDKIEDLGFDVKEN